MLSWALPAQIFRSSVSRALRRSACTFIHNYKLRAPPSNISIPQRRLQSFQIKCISTNTHPTHSDTIFALSSGAGIKSGVSVIRISGPQAPQHLLSLTPSKDLPKPRLATLRKLYSPDTNELLDNAITILFCKPRSFTGEDVVELHVHGSRAVVSGVLTALSNLGARPAGRGEFTRRAFENGRMDLTEVEGLADLIASETSEQRRQALSQMGGGLKVLYEGWREKLKECLARAEACIDFGEEVDIEEFDRFLPVVCSVRDEMKRHLQDRKRGEIVRDGFKVAIVGPPNAGKSTLFNMLAKRDAAIVSPVAGTTRDVLEIHLDLNGIPVTVSDTAGLRHATEDVIEREGISRAKGVASNAELTLFLQDASIQVESREPRERALKSFDLQGNGNVITVLNKTDLVPDQKLGESGAFKTSLLKGEGVDDLLQEIECRLKSLLEGPGSEQTIDTLDRAENMPVITRERHRIHVTAASQALDAFISGRTMQNPRHLLPMDLAAEELRVATREIGAITGIVHVEEVLDVIFSEFCIGK